MKKILILLSFTLISFSAFSQKDTTKSKTDTATVKEYVLKGTKEDFEYMRMVIMKSKLSYEEVRPLLDWMDKQLIPQIFLPPKKQ